MARTVVAWSRLSMAASWFAIAAVAIWFAAFRLWGDRVAYLGYVNAAGFAWGSLALAAGAFLLIRRSPAGLIGVGLGVAILYMGVALLGGRPTADRGAAPMRFVTASLRTANTDMADAARVLGALDADVLAIQEANDPPALLAAMRARGGPAWTMTASGSTLILSRFPLRSRGGADGLLKAEVAVAPDAIARVWTFRAPKTYDRPAEIGRWFAAATNGMDEERPHVVAGDHNATPWNGGYRTMAARMTDAFRAGGVGPGFTFPTPARRMGTLSPFVRIDHVFVDRQVGVVRAFVADASRGADHFPVVADLLIPRAGQPSRRMANEGMRTD